MIATEYKSFKIIEHPKKVMEVRLDVPGRKFNILAAEAFGELRDLFVALEKDPVGALVITSGKKDSFVAGADIQTLNSIQTAEEGREMSSEAQKVFDLLEDLPFPTVIAIHGVCLGGGLELALAADYRLVSDNSALTVLGLPEVQLGLIPGAGGTQRLPRLVGLPSALEMILASSRIRPRKALKIGLADEMVPETIIIRRGVEAATELAEKEGMAHKRWTKRSHNLLTKVASSVGVRSAVYSQAKADLNKKTKGLYPAPYKALDAARAAMRMGREEGMELEARLFGEVAETSVSKSLIHLFNATTDIKADSGVDDESVEPKELDKVAMIGGGLMGSGISTVLADKKVPVLVKDISQDALGRTLEYVYKVLDKKRKRRIYSNFDRDMRMAQLVPTTDYTGFGSVPIVIEAVFEDIALKHRILKEVEEHAGEDVIFASNTSSLPIAEIAKAAKKPEQVIGMHFFSPVEKMQLVEVIVTKDTADWVTATTVNLGKKMGKHVIVVGDGAGFYTSRVLAAFCNEAVRCLFEGAAIEKIDRAISSLGFPVGPMILMDEVGIGVVSKVMKIMMDAFPSRFQAPEGWQDVLAGREGKKSGKGFYLYKGKDKQPDESVYDIMGVETIEWDKKEIQDRCLYAFLNECAFCLQEEILRNPRDGDVGAVFGLGFPPYMGGPFFAMDNIGLEKVVARLEELQEAYGDHFAPADLLLDMVKSGKTFYNS